MRRVLTLDLSGKTGWSRWADDLPKPASGVRIFDAVNHGTRNREARQWLVRTIQTHAIERVVKEALAVRMGNTNADAQEIQIYLHGLTLEVCSTLGVPCEDMAVNTWRSTVFGTAAAPKHIVKERRRLWWKRQAVAKARELGWDVTSDDEAEALLIGHAYRLRTDRTYAVHSTPLLSGALA